MLAKISLAISILLAIAVGYLLFKAGKTKTIEPVQIAPAFSGDGTPRATVMAYVIADSLYTKYDYIVENAKDLEGKMKIAEEKVKREYGSRQARYESNMRYAQENPNMPESEMMALQKDNEQLQAEMDEIQQKEGGVIQKKQEELQKEVDARINKFLDVYAKQRGIDYVISRQSQLPLVLYGNNAYDVTSEVIAGLNEEYRAEKEKK